VVSTPTSVAVPNDQTSSDDDVELPGPIRVLFVDAETELPDVSPVREAGGRYHAVLVFAVPHGRLVGEVELPLGKQGMSGSELGEHLRRELGEQWASPPPPAAPAGPPPFISIVVPTTMERLDELDRCLDSLLALDYPDFEVILVDNRPDSTPERAKLYARLSRHPRVRVVGEARRGISAARNHGVQVARGDLVAFTDDDAVVHPRWLRGIGDRFQADPAVGCVSGMVLPAELETRVQIWFERSGSKLGQRYRPVSYHNDGAWRGLRLGRLRRARFEIIATTDDGETENFLVYHAGAFGMGANISFRKSALDLIGGFDEALGTGTAARGGEDILALARLLYRGGRVTMDTASIVLHYHRPDYPGSRRQMYGYGVGATAALVAQIWSDPRHLIGLMYILRPAIRVLLGRSANRKVDNYPKDLARTELRGLAAGPFAYIRSMLNRARRT
jgi:glycosyltransferase involved in cell wall biosynthesis